ncbi:hypothetical protein LCGC14_1295650 [marine sediment metagenome]|uniref:Polysaccharide biosynthesis protein CapD-like domain-containing protein n=1 Tax=marine sediment metagenome TaxID=412755 RepID=A0A0F9NU16_9ZZZZ
MATILITGGTGSFGRAFLSFMLENGDDDDVIRIFSRDEQKQEAMKREIKDNRVRYLIGDVRDYQRVHRAMRDVDIVIHAAALKIVPAGEYNPDEMIKTNVIGSHNVVEAAVDRGVSNVVCLSSDKAVAPVNLYGNTKACMERLALLANGSSGDTKISVVRYGNVIGSRGSILTFLADQAKTGALNIAHRDSTRFWITLGQACELVLSVIASQYGGDIFIPKLKSTRILDLCQTLYPDVPVKYTGLRPGDKVHEWLTNEYEHICDAGFAWRIMEPAAGGRWEIGNVPISSGDCIIPAKELLAQPDFAAEVDRALAA